MPPGTKRVSAAGNTFNTDFGVITAAGESHGLSVFLRDGDSVFPARVAADAGVPVVAASR